MRVLVLLEHDGQHVRLGSRSAIAFARAIAEHTSGAVTSLVLGHQLETVAADACAYSAVLAVDNAALAKPLADRYAKVIADVTRGSGFDLLVAASTTWSKDIVARAAGLLGGAMVSEVVGHEFGDGQLSFRRPMFAGSVLATVALSGTPQVVTIRSSAYAPAAPSSSPFEVTLVSVDESKLASRSEFLGLESKATGRPEVTEARIVVSGGRAIKSSEDFERLVGGLADKLGAATGSSRALVDAGITPNALQVGQTGKIVAPDLYIALGISGAVQHLSGMKNSKVIVAINRDPDAPIFEYADYALLGDVYEIVPELIEKLNCA